MNRPIGLMAMVFGLALFWFSPPAWANHAGSFTMIHGRDGGYATIVDGKLQVEADINLEGATIEGGGTSSTFGAAFPSDGTAIGCSDGANMVACGTASNPWTVNLGTIGGAATAANQTTIIGHVDGLETSLSSIDGKFPSALVGGRFDINIGASGLTLSVRCRSTDDSGFEACGGGGAGGGDGTIIDGAGAGEADVIGSNPAGTEQGLVVRNIPSGTQPVSAASLPLPSGAATSAAQSTGNTSLGNIDTSTSGLTGKFPSAAAAAENMSNATTMSSILSRLMLFDGTAWDRAPGNSTDGLLVNLGANNDVAVTGSVTADTELPAASALADGMANPTAPAVAAHLMCWNGTTWDRCRSGVSSAVDTQVSCTTSSSVLKAANSARLKVDYQNISTTTVFVCHAATCTTNGAGKRLKEDMGYTESVYSGAISCITAAGTATVGVTEE